MRRRSSSPSVGTPSCRSEPALRPAQPDRGDCLYGLQPRSRTSRGRRCTAAWSGTASAVCPRSRMTSRGPSASPATRSATSTSTSPSCAPRRASSTSWSRSTAPPSSPQPVLGPAKPDPGARLADKANVHTASDVLTALIEAVPYRIHTVLTDNGVQFCDAPRNRAAVLPGCNHGILAVIMEWPAPQAASLGSRRSTNGRGAG